MIRKVLNLDLSVKQAKAYLALASNAVEELLYGGAKGGGKSVFGCIWCYLQAKFIIKNFSLKPGPVIPVVGFMGRKRSVDFTMTTLETWKKIIPSDAYELKKSEKLIIIEGTVSIRYGGLDDSETISKFNSMELAFAFIDQAEETSEDEVAMVSGTFRLKINGKECDYKLLLTANPAKCWLKPTFIRNPEPGRMFIKALPADNPYLPDSYVPRLQRAFRNRPELVKAYIHGSWEDLDGAFAIIPERDIEGSVLREPIGTNKTFRITVADLGEEGEDETVIYNSLDSKVASQEIYAHRDLMATVGRIQANAKKNDSNLIAVDKVGIGAGVYSRLREIYRNDRDMRVIGWDSRIKAPAGLNDETYTNYKAYAWFKAAEKFHNGQASIPDDHVLISQLSGVTYRILPGEKLAVEDKKELRRILSGSPDRADAYVMLLDCLDKADPVEVKDRYVVSRRREYNPNTV